MTLNRQPEQLHPKDINEVDVLSFDFKAMLKTGELINSAIVTCEAHVGVDAGAAAVLSGVPEVDGSVVLQKVTGGVAGVIYRIRARVVLDSTRELVLAAWLPVLRLGE